VVQHCNSFSSRDGASVLRNRTGVSSQQGLGNGPNRIESPFGLALVKAEVDGTPVTLILDTGSSHTIFSTRLAHVHPSTFETRAAPAKGSGWVGTAVKVKATLKIG